MDDSSSDLSYYHDDSSSNISYNDEEDEEEVRNASMNNDDGGNGICGVVQNNGTGDESNNNDSRNHGSKSGLQVATFNRLPSLINEHRGEEDKEINDQALDEIKMMKERNDDDSGVILQQQLLQQQQQTRQQEQNMKLRLLQQKRNQLLSKISQIKNKRNQIYSETQSTQKEIKSKMYQYNETLYKRKHSLSHYSSLQRKLQSLFKEKDKLDSINVLQDVFYIFHRGHFTTMNGLRLGISVPSQQTVAPSPTSSAAGLGLGVNVSVGAGAVTNGSNNNSMHNASGQYNNDGGALSINTKTNTNAPDTMSSLLSTNGQSLSFAPQASFASVLKNDYQSQQQQQHHHGHSTQNEVPWHEINAGIGMVALLISTMQSKLNLRSRFTILPRGSTTKICFNTSAGGSGSSSLEDFFASNSGDGSTGSGSRSGSNDNGAGTGLGVGFGNIMNNNSNQEWDLYYHPATFSFFAKRHWNTALNILGYCLYEVVEEVKRRLESFQAQNNTNDIIDNDDNSNLHNGSGNGRGSGSGTVYSSMSGGSPKDENQYSPSEMKIMIPYDVTLSGDWKSSERSTGYVKIGGLDIGFNGDGIAWTKALRYVATDLKWVIAFIAKYVDL